MTSLFFLYVTNDIIAHVIIIPDRGGGKKTTNFDHFFPVCSWKTHIRDKWNEEGLYSRTRTVFISFLFNWNYNQTKMRERKISKHFSNSIFSILCTKPKTDDILLKCGENENWVCICGYFSHSLSLSFAHYSAVCVCVSKKKLKNLPNVDDIFCSPV